MSRPAWKPFESERSLADYTPALSLPDPQAIGSTVALPELPFELPAVAVLLQQFLPRIAGPLDIGPFGCKPSEWKPPDGREIMSPEDPAPDSMPKLSGPSTPTKLSGPPPAAEGRPMASSSLYRMAEELIGLRDEQAPASAF